MVMTMVNSATHPETDQPVLYSFRRCPYALRARLGLAAAGLQPGVDLELREVSLKAKPPELLTASSKGTVPVLVVGGIGAGEAPTVLAESLDVMHWALEHQDPGGWWQGRSTAEQTTIKALIAQNDGPFKHHLDRFKYAGRFGEQGVRDQQHHRQAALAILRDWNQRLEPGSWLLGDRPSLADWALLPFVRQFRLADPLGFDDEPGLLALQTWLQRCLISAELAAVMAPPWAARSPWRSPSWLYHLALSDDWQAARSAEADYCISTRGRTLAEAGFIHLSLAHQVAATATRFYGDLPAGAVKLLVIDPARLQEAGLSVRHEPAPGTGELFPHLYGPLPLAAVVHSEAWMP
jgi:glutathione S-transferase